MTQKQARAELHALFRDPPGWFRRLHHLRAVRSAGGLLPDEAPALACLEKRDRRLWERAYPPDGIPF